MMNAAAVLLLSASLAQSAPISVAVLDWTGAGVERAKLSSLAERLGDRLSVAGAKVSTPRAIAAILGLERQRQLLGCSDEASSCLAEIAAALGTEAIAMGDAIKTSQSIQLSVKLVAAKDGAVLATWEGVAANDDELFALVGPAVDHLFPAAAAKLGRRAPRARSWLFLLPSALGAAACAGALVTQSVAGQKYAAIPTSPEALARSAADVAQLRREGETAQWATRGLLIAGAAGLVAGAVLFVTGFLTGEPPAVSSFMALTPEGGLLGFGGRL